MRKRKTAQPRPIQLEDIAAAARCPVYVRDLERFAGVTYRGVCIRSFDTKTQPLCILLNSRYRGRRRRQTLAHELAHAGSMLCCPDRFHNTPDAVTALYEEEHVDKIAAEILLPADLVLLEVMKAGKADVRALARHFGAPVAITKARLEYLKLR